jgi:hypothetical protein
MSVCVSDRDHMTACDRGTRTTHNTLTLIASVRISTKLLSTAMSGATVRVCHVHDRHTYTSQTHNITSMPTRKCGSKRDDKRVLHHHLTVVQHAYRHKHVKAPH